MALGNTYLVLHYFHWNRLFILERAPLVPLVPRVRQVEQRYGAGGRHQEHHVKPPDVTEQIYLSEHVSFPSPVIEVELEVSEHLGDDGPVLRGHVHPHQHHHRPGHERHLIGQRIEPSDWPGLT